MTIQFMLLRCMFIQSAIICSFICMGGVGLLTLFTWAVSLRSLRSQRAQKEKLSGFSLVQFSLSSLILCVMLATSVYIFLQQPSDEEIFTRDLGISVTSDIVIQRLQSSGFGDHGSLSVCFQAASTSIDKLIAVRKLRPISIDESGRSNWKVKACVGEKADYYARMTGAGTGSSDRERVNGFSSTEQFLAYDQATQMAYYFFQGID